MSLESTYEWEVYGGDDWCSVSPQSGEGDVEVVFTIDPNMTEDDRSAEFVFTSGNKKTTLTVTQEKKGIQSTLSQMKSNLEQKAENRL